MPCQIILYTTSNCHLCESAHELILLFKNKIDLRLVEIADDDSLMMKYGTRIPVLLRLDTLSELNWPFTYDNIDNFIKV